MSNQLMVPGVPDEEWRGIVEKLISELDDDIPEKVVRATELLLAGYPTGKAAKEVGVTADTVKSWIRKYPTVAHVLADGRRYMQLWRMSQLEQQFVKAVDKSEEILNLSFYDDTVNQKLVGTVAQHARFIISLFAGQQVDINVKPTASDPVMKAKADALDYIAQRLAERQQDDEPVTVSYQVIDTRTSNGKPLLNAKGEPAFGQLGVLDVTPDGALCHICGKRERMMALHLHDEHSLAAGDYEAIFLLDEGAIRAYDNREDPNG